MGKRGPRPEPTKLRIVKGNPGKRALPEDEPEPTGSLPPPPKDLSKAAARIWTKTLKLCAEWCATIDEETFRQYCTLTATLHELEANIARDGHTVDGAMGGTVRNPDSLALTSVGALRLRAAESLGFTPSSRTKVKAIGRKKGADPYAD